MAGELITRDGQVEYQGLLLGEGTDYPIGVDGIEGLGTPEVRSGKTARPQAHGMFPAVTYAGARPVTFKFAVLGDDQADTVEKMNAFGATWVPQASEALLPLVYRIGGVNYRIYGQADRWSPTLTDLKSATIEAVAQFVATDPRIYSDTLDTETVGLSTTTGGLGFAHGFPHGFGSVTGGAVAAQNAGTFDAPWTATVTATATLQNPKIENADTGEYVEAIITLAAGDVLVFDSLERTVTLNGQASRSNTLRRPETTWFGLAPGTTNVRFIAASGTGELELSWRSAWM